MKYKRKTELIDAIEFEYSEGGLLTLKGFCGACLTRYGARHLPTTGPWAYIRESSGSSKSITAMAGEMVIRDSNGKFSSMSKNEFEQLYEVA
jgi:hypothetical protein